MNIIFDIEIKYPDCLERCTVKQLEVLYNMRSFVAERIKVLEENINAEEAQSPGKVVVIDLTNMKLVAFKYSTELTEKILGCFADNDIAWMWTEVEAIIKEGFN